MSFVLIAPEFVTAAAGDLTNLGSSISAANASAASATTQVLAAGADEVSARIAALFGGFGLEYQAISAQVAAYHQRFVQALSTGAGAYASAEAAAAEQIVLGVINAPTQALLGRPLIGDGATNPVNKLHSCFPHPHLNASMHVWAHPELGQTAGAGPGSARVVNHNFGRPPASSAPPKPLSGGRSRPIRDRRDGLKVAFPQCLGMCRPLVPAQL